MATTQTVSSQLRAKAGTAKVAAATAKKPVPQGGPATTTAKKLTAGKNAAAQKAAEAKAATPNKSGKTPERIAEEKEAKKKAAFAKLKERAQQKRAAAVEARKGAMKVLRGELNVGDHKFLTRASYYGVEVEIEGFEEVRGRNLVIVRCLTTKKGRELEEDATYIRRVSPKFLADERPTDPYVQRRGSAATTSEEEAEEELEDEAEESEEEDESEDEEDTEEESDEEEDDTEAEAELEESDEEEGEDEEDGEEDEESWG